MIAALSNMVLAMPTGGPFLRDLAKGATNSGEPEAAAVWLLDFVSRWLERQGFPHGPIAAFDYAICDIEALDRVWPLLECSEAAYREQGFLADCESPLPAIARFLVERMPSIWEGASWTRHAPATRALVLADRADYLVGFFGAGIMPTGSKDPYALRRAGKHFLMQAMFPITARQDALAA